MNQKIQLEISPWTVIKVVLVLVGFYLVYFVKDILILLLFAIILSATFRPLVDRWERKIKRVPAVLAILIIMVGIIAFVSYAIFPPLVKQIESFIQSLPGITDRLKFLAPYKNLLSTSVQSIVNNLGGLTGGFVNLTTSIFGGIFAVIIAIILTVYLLLDQKSTDKFISNTVPAESKEAVFNLINKMSLKMGDWFRGQLALATIVGVVYYIALLILGIPYALTLGLLSGMLDFIPTIGPTIAGIVSALVALAVSPIHAVIVVVLYIIIQQIENSVLVPKIMQKAVGLSPVIIILAVTVGAKVLGIIGALLAVPLSALISVFIQEWPSIRATFNKND